MASYNPADLFSVKGMVAAITGGGSGLGLYAARALDLAGAKKVYIIGRRQQTLEDAAKTAKNGTLVPIVGDVTDKASLLRITEQIRKEEGFVNLVFANAGVSGPRTRQDVPALAQGGKPSVREMQEGMLKPSMEDFTHTSHVNLTGVYYTAAAFLDLLAAGNAQKNMPTDSQILVTSSVAGFSRHLASSFAYSTSKAAVNHLVKMLATSFAQNQFRIRVNLIAPGLYPSEMTGSSMQNLAKFEGVEGHAGAFEGAHVMKAEGSPAERTGSEEDFAGTVLFMVGRAGAYLNGETLVSDGGRLSQLPAVY